MSSILIGSPSDKLNYWISQAFLWYRLFYKRCFCGTQKIRLIRSCLYSVKCGNAIWIRETVNSCLVFYITKKCDLSVNLTSVLYSQKNPDQRKSVTSISDNSTYPELPTYLDFPQILRSHNLIYSFIVSKCTSLIFTGDP